MHVYVYIHIYKYRYIYIYIYIEREREREVGGWAAAASAACRQGQALRRPKGGGLRYATIIYSPPPINVYSVYFKTCIQYSK